MELVSNGGPMTVIRKLFGPEAWGSFLCFGCFIGHDPGLCGNYQYKPSRVNQIRSMKRDLTVWWFSNYQRACVDLYIGAPAASSSSFHPGRPKIYRSFNRHEGAFRTSFQMSIHSWKAIRSGL